MRIPSIDVNVLKNMYKMICESMMLCGAEISGAEIDYETQGIFCTKDIRSPRGTANAAADWKFDRESRRGINCWEKVKF
jgi:hypothetical protein